MKPCCCGAGSLRKKTWLTLASHRTTETSSEIQQVNKSYSLSHKQKHLNTCRTSTGSIMGLSGWRHWVFPAQPPFVAATSSPTNAATAIGSDPNSSASDAALLLRRGQSAQANLADTDRESNDKDFFEKKTNRQVLVLVGLSCINTTTATTLAEHHLETSWACPDGGTGSSLRRPPSWQQPPLRRMPQQP